MILLVYCKVISVFFPAYTYTQYEMPVHKVQDFFVLAPSGENHYENMPIQIY